MKTRRLGSLDVSEIAFGTMSFASTYGASPDEAEAVRVIRGAYDLGVTYLDTAEVMVPGPMESWWARLLSSIWAGFALTLAGLLFFAAIYPLLRKASVETALA